MAVLTLNKTTGPTLTGTFNSIRLGGEGGPNSPSTPHVVLTSCTLTNGATLTTTAPWNLYIDPTTNTTVRVPLGDVQSLI